MRLPQLSVEGRSEQLTSSPNPAGTGGAELTTALGDLLDHYQADSVAVYLPADRGDYRRWVDTGEGMPERWGKDDEPAIRLDGGLIGFSAGTDLDRAQPLAVRLIAALLHNRQLDRQLRYYRFQSGLDDVRLQSLYDVGLAIASTLDRDQLIDEILMRAVALLDARRGALFLYRDNELRLAGAVGGDAVARLDVEPDELGDLTRNLAADELLPGAEFALAHPIEADLRRLGVLVVGDKESRTGVGAFGDSDSPTLGLFASQAAIALENARLHREALAKERLEREMELASEIQQRLLPRTLPTLEGFEFAAWSRSARHVGGDYHDVIPLANDRVALVLGDVSGKGVPASLLVSTVHSALRLLLEQCGVESDLLARLNDHVAASSASNKFVTFFVAELGAGRGEIRYGNAGHNPALVVSSDLEVRELCSGGMPLGMIAGAPYRDDAVEMNPGDLLCVYSDGITEAENPLGEEFGTSRLTEVLTRVQDQSTQAIVECIQEAVESFASGTPQGDDQTLLIARRTG